MNLFFTHRLLNSIPFRPGVAERGRPSRDEERRRTENFFRLRPPQGRERTADRLTFVRSGRRRTRDGGVRPPQGRIWTADRQLFVSSGRKRAAGAPHSSVSRTVSDGGQGQFRMVNLLKVTKMPMGKMISIPRKYSNFN